MNNTIKCIHCGKDFKVSDALGHELEEEKKRIIKIAEEDVRRKLQTEFEGQAKEQKLALEEEKKKNRELAIEFEKKLKQDEEKIRVEATKEVAENHRLERLEFEKKISDMQKSLEDAQRKAKQGSQQLQGEVLELDLEGRLKTQFPLDEFLPVPKGIEGGDIWHKVRDERGKIIGSILWETKRTKNWDNKWLPKLREDTRKIGASIAILVSDVLPDGVKSFHQKDKVWICNYEYALHTAGVVRYVISIVSTLKLSVSHNDDNLQRIHDYIISDAFIHRIEAHSEAVSMMREDLFSEIRLTQTRWKKRETQINRLDTSISQLHGDLQGIIPELKDIQVETLASGKEEQELV